jgi:hypothetical protein
MTIDEGGGGTRALVGDVASRGMRDSRVGARAAPPPPPCRF